MIEGPYKLPKGWHWVRLGEVCIINPRRPRIFREPNRPISFIPMSAIDEETGTITAPEVRPFKELSKGYTYFEENDILFAKITPCMENGKVAIARGLTDRIGFGSTEFHVLRPKSSVLSEWIWLFIRRKQFREDAKKFFRGGVGQQRVPQEFLEHYPIPLPPLDEQKRIVARVEELMSRIKEVKKLREETKKQTELLWQSVLAETFPQPGAQPPKGWRWVKLGEVAKIFSGSSAPQGRQYFEGGTYPFVRVQDLGRYRITDDLRETVDKVNEYAIKKLRLVKAKKGSIVFPKSGAAILTNSRAILGIDAYVVSHLAIVEPNYTKVDNHWIFYYLCSVDMAKFIDNPSYPSLRLSKIKEIPIPLPPLEVQKRIANYLQELHEKIKELKEVQTKTEEEIKLLEQSILEKAFRGEL